MGETKSFVFYPDWRMFIKGLSDEAFESMIKPAIDRSQKNYQASKDYGKTHGRPKTAIEDQIEAMCKKGMKANDIAAALGCSATSVYHSEAWKNRKK